MSMENQPDTPVAPQAVQQSQVPQPDGDEINLMDLLLVIARHNRFILKFTGGAAVLAVVVSLLMTNIFTGKAVIMTPQVETSTASMLLGQLTGIAGVGGGVGGGAAGSLLGLKNPGDIYVGMFKSRTVADALIQRFKLMELYETEYISDARKTLENATNITAGKDGLITIEYSDKDPVRAAAIANAYIEELDRLSQTLAVTEAAQRRLFFEKQLKETRAGLEHAEIEMRDFQEQNRVFRLEGQGTMALGASGRIPKVELEYVQKLREVKRYEALFEAMAQQATLAKIDEAKDTAIIQVVDKALPPDRKSKPKRSLIVLLTTMLAMFIGILWAFFKEAAERAGQDPEQAERISLLRRYFRQGK